MMADALSLGALLSASLPLRAVPHQEDDLALIERIKRGDRRAFDLLFRRHADDVHRRLTRLIGPDPEREDLVQEVFVAAVASGHEYGIVRGRCALALTGRDTATHVKELKKMKGLEASSSSFRAEALKQLATKKKA